jgi:ribosomal protein L11 methyltransferase
MDWLEITVDVDHEAVEAVSELLARYGYNSGVVIEPGWTPGDEGPEFSYNPQLPVRMRTYLTADDQAEAHCRQLEQALWHLGQMRPVGPLQTRILAEADWANAWKEHYQVLRVGERIVVVPSWIDYEPQADDVVLRLDPGMAFGTGLHPTTQLCLQLLERYAPTSRRMLDLGTGSAILALAAAGLGSASILALDNDPVAIEVAAENVARNQAAGQITTRVGSLGPGMRMGHWLSGDFGETGPTTDETDEPSLPQFDLIAANLIARVLVILADSLKAALSPGGILISSGIIDQREPEVIAAFEAAGLRLIERFVDGEWIALVHTHDDSENRSGAQ